MPPSNARCPGRASRPALNYAIVKGSYDEFTVILNVTSLAAEVVRAANPVSKTVTKAVPQVTLFHLYEDPSPGDYYMASSRARTQRVWGKSDIAIRLHGRTFVYPTTSFSQVNPGIAEQLVTQAGQLLQLQPQQQLFDLYSGYGLFALCLAGRVEQVTGVEWSSDAVDAAIQNARRQRISNARFLTRNVDPESLQKVLRTARPQDAVLLDPPRSGTLPGVIETIAAARPARIVHIFCHIDILPDALATWRCSGYIPRRAIPFDMFPGTDALETMVLLEST